MSVPTPAAAMAICDSLEEEVLIALVRAAWLAAERSNAVTAAAGLSPSQYNVLRILRAAGRGGLSCTEIGARMVTRDSDLTRLMSGLARAGFVVRGTIPTIAVAAPIGSRPRGGPCFVVSTGTWPTPRS